MDLSLSLSLSLSVEAWIWFCVKLEATIQWKGEFTCHHLLLQSLLRHLQQLRDSGERKILFYPKQHQVVVSQDGCQAAIPLFLGHLGLYIEGSVSPPLADVYIRIIAGADSQNAPTKPAEVVLETTTGEDGVFIGGPLYDDITYNVEASKEYDFSPAA